MINFTSAIACDASYVKYLRCVWPTWKRFRPEVFSQPMVVLHDCALPAAEMAFIDHPNVEFVAVPEMPNATQRERMLTAFIMLVPWLVKTPWFAKIDADVVARRNDPGWCSDDRAAPNEKGQVPVFVASGWNYTRPSNAIALCDAWGSTVDGVKEFPAMNLPYDPAAKRVSTPGRIASYVYLGRTDWHQWIAGLCRRLPIPSQDTYAWYVAKRRGDFYRCWKMKRAGWDFVNHRAIERVAKEIMEAP